MLASTLSVDFLNTTFRDDLGVLLARWHRGVSPIELRQGYDNLLAAAAPQRGRFWLLDLRRRGPSPEDDTLWVLETFLPRLAPTLGGRVYLAFLLAPAHLAAVDQENGASLVSNAQCHARLFTDEGLALAWLARRRQHESA